MAILARNDIISKVRTIDKVEDKGIEILWITLQTDAEHDNLAVGVYYGPQENIMERQMSILNTHIHIIKQNANTVITGDCNAKIPIHVNGIDQQISRNGKYLMSMCKETDLTPISAHEKYATWTRVNRKNNQERSIIDYILVENNKEHIVEDLHIDNEGQFKIKNEDYTKINGTNIEGNETDHNTMIITIKNTLTIKTTKKTMWKKGTEENWKTFNKIIQNENIKSKILEYDELESAIKEALTKSIGVKTITQNKKNREPKEVKNARKIKREKKEGI